MSQRGLFPGYSEVQTFASDEDYVFGENGEIEEEVSYVTLDLGGVEPTLVPSSSTYRLVGLDTPTPFLQLSGTAFKGKHQTLLGTELIFTEGTGKRDCIPPWDVIAYAYLPPDDPEQHQKSVAHFVNTEQRIRFDEVELRPKSPAKSSPTSRPTHLTNAESAASVEPQTSQMPENHASGTAGKDPSSAVQE